MDGVRDTDADWRLIGDEQPYWGVLTNAEFRTEALTDRTIERFYETGREDAGFLAELIGRISGRPPVGGRALDFGCGAGRIAEAIRDVCDEVVGVDVSPGMLETARRRSGRVTYLTEIPEGRFDWINCYIVLQHIDPARGMGILTDLAGRLTEDGAISVQVPYDPAHRGFHLDRLSPPVGTISMYLYDLNAVMGVLKEAGVDRMSVAHTHHGLAGVIIAGRRSEPG